MDDDIKSGALQSMCPEGLRTHLCMNSKRLQDYAPVRAEIIAYIEAQGGIRMKTLPSKVRDPSAMDIRSLKSGKGQRDHSHVQCYGCGEYGHIKQQCSAEVSVYFRDRVIKIRCTFARISKKFRTIWFEKDL